MPMGVLVHLDTGQIEVIGERAREIGVVDETRLLIQPVGHSLLTTDPEKAVGNGQLLG